MGKLTTTNSDGEVFRTRRDISDGDAWNRLAEYEDTGLMPSELYGMTDTIFKLVKRNDKQYKELQKAIKDRDYWKAEAIKHCAKLGEIKLLMGRSNG